MALEEVENFFNILNGEKKSIQFTLEMEGGSQIPYLDMVLERTRFHRISTSYYQKPTSKNLLLNFASEHPLIQRTEMAYSIISRILTLTAEKNRPASINKIFDLLKMYGFPGKLVAQRSTNFTKKMWDKEKYNRPRYNE